MSVHANDELGDAPPLSEATADLGYYSSLSYRMQAPCSLLSLGACGKTPSFSAGAAPDDQKSCPEPNKTVPDPVHGSSLDQATWPKGGRPTATPPSWLSPAHPPGCSRPTAAPANQ